MDESVLGIGGTLGPDGQPVHPTAGYAVGIQEYPSLEAAMAAAHPDKFVGYWRDQADNGRLYVDLVVIMSERDQAIELGRKHDQIAIWDFANESEIRLRE